MRGLSSILSLLSNEFHKMFLFSNGNKVHVLGNHVVALRSLRFCHTCLDPEGDRGVRTLLKNHKNIAFLINTGPDPLKNHKATKPEFSVGPSSARQRRSLAGR